MGEGTRLLTDKVRETGERDAGGDGARRSCDRIAGMRGGVNPKWLLCTVELFEWVRSKGMVGDSNGRVGFE